jgi:hypothetical protein
MMQNLYWNHWAGPVVPDGWQGALPITYHVGDSKTKVHLKLEFNWNMVPCYDVIAMIKGAQFPDEWVMRGNHHDAWVNGANDPISGQSAMLEEAKAIGELLKTGWKPKRTIVYCSLGRRRACIIGFYRICRRACKRTAAKDSYLYKQRWKWKGIFRRRWLACPRAIDGRNLKNSHRSANKCFCF